VGDRVWDVGAEIGLRADLALSRGGQATRLNTGMPRPVMILVDCNPALRSPVCFFLGSAGQRPDQPTTGVDGWDILHIPPTDRVLDLAA
jgi:hypothetical protein